MYLKIDNQLFNSENFQYFEYENKILNLVFNGNVSSKIEQEIEDFQSLVNLLKENKNNIFIENIGINLKNVSGISKEDESTLLFFVDGTFKKFNNILFSNIENQIIGE